MTPAEFKRKWSRYQGKESAAYQEHFNDLCRLLGQKTPAEADPSGSDFFCFQKRVVKDLELFELGDLGEEDAQEERGFADVWKKDCFGWEYKGKKRSLDEAYKQLLHYREALLNPPLLVVCDFDRYIIRTNFNGTVQDIYEFTNDQIDRPENWRVLRAAFENPEFLKPQRTTAQVTEALARTIAEVAKSLQKREAVELADAKTRAELNFAQRKNLRIARFLNRIVFCFFAEDTGLLPRSLFTDLLKAGFDDLTHFAVALEQLFAVMASGGAFGKNKIRHFNGHLFEDSTVFELTEEELRKLAEASEADWQFIQPSIMGTLFERALEPGQRAQLGAHYTSEADIKTLVEPVLMAPLRREWAALKTELAAACATGRGAPAQRDRLAAFQKKLAAIAVLDPACGSGNFLYVALRMLLDLEKELFTWAAQLGFRLTPQVSVRQLAAIEINPYAFELAQVSVQIGFLQWRRDNGFDNDRSPVLQELDGFQNEDALLLPHFRSKAKTLKEAQAGEHADDDALRFYTERDWPKCDVILSNPPFLGGKMIRRELGDGYVDAMFETYGRRVRPEADFCCYWFEKARKLIEDRKCRRAGLLATQAIRGGANRDTLKRIKETGDIFFAASDRPWVLAGANVHISMVGFDNGAERCRVLDGKTAKEITPQLTAESRTHTAVIIETNQGLSFMGITPAGPFDVPAEVARDWLAAPNPSGRPSSDVLRPYFNGNDLTKRARQAWTIDFGVGMPMEEAALYEKPFGYLDKEVRPLRQQNRREAYARNWWLYAESRPAMRESFSPLARYLATCMVAKHRMFVWLDAASLPANVVIVFGRSDDYFFGVLHSRFHETWALAQGTQLREKESGFRYTPTTCFETFPFPFPDDLGEPPPLAAETAAEPETRELNGGMARMVKRRFLEIKEEPPPYDGAASATLDREQHRAAVAAAAKDLNHLRECWLNPPEWTETCILEFPGTVGGPWDRYIDCRILQNGGGFQVGVVRYPRLEPRDADCAARLKKRTLTNLYNERPAWLDLAHQKLDAAVAAAYGWPADLPDEVILERLLALNLERAAVETKAEQMAKPKAQRGQRAGELI